MIPRFAALIAAALLIPGIGPRGAGKGGDLIMIPLSSSDLRAHVEVLASGTPRSVDHPAALERAAQYIEKQFERAGYAPVSHPYEVEGGAYRNVIATLNPGGRGVVVIGAHYDVAGDQPGADDNASGVAGLLEIAKALRRFENELEDQIQFAAYSTEEPPHFRTESMGSWQHAADLRSQGAQVRLMISLEMIGYFTDAARSQGYPFGVMRWVYPREGNFIAVVSTFGQGRFLRGLQGELQRAGVNAERLSAPAFLPGVDFSDHRCFLRQGFKAVMVTDTAFYRNPHYHQPTDAPDTLDYARMARVAEGVARYALRLAGRRPL